MSENVIPFNRADSYKKSNLLISSKFSSSLLENQIQACAMQNLHETADGQIISVMPASMIKQALNKNYCQMYEELKKVSLKLKKNFIMIEDPEKHKFQISNIITDCIYDEGMFTIKYNPTLRNIIFSLKSYTILSLEAMCSWKSNATFRLYEILKSECYYPKGVTVTDNVFEKTYNLSELKVTLGAIDLTNEKISGLVNNKKAPDYDELLDTVEIIAGKDKSVKKPRWNRWVDFNKQVLIPATEEINTNPKSDLKVEYTPIKGGKGGKVIGVKFVLALQKDSKEPAKEEKILTDDEMYDILELLQDLLGLKLRECKQIAEAAEWNMDIIREKYEISKTQDIKSLAGWMIEAIRNDYQKPVSKSKHVKNSFCNFEERQYDYDELMKISMNQ